MTASEVTKALFLSPGSSDKSVEIEPPPESMWSRQSKTRVASTNISLSEATRGRFLLPCVCEFPLGFTEQVVTVTCATQTMAPDTLIQQVQTCESEQGASQLADAGRAEAHITIDEI